jgi:hypothetical protein
MNDFSTCLDALATNRRDLLQILTDLTNFPGGNFLDILRFYKVPFRCVQLSSSVPKQLPVDSGLEIVTSR